MRDVIYGDCFTNLDEFRGVDWPQQFAAVPRIGERVQGERNGPGTGTRPTLKVVGVTHVFVKGRPEIRVELHR